MAEVLGLDGRAITGPVSENTPLAVLQKLVAAVEAGTLKPEKMLVIVEEAMPNNPGNVRHPTFDNGITAAEAVFLLETAKADIFEILRR